MSEIKLTVGDPEIGTSQRENSLETKDDEACYRVVLPSYEIYSKHNPKHNEA